MGGSVVEGKVVVERRENRWVGGSELGYYNGTGLQWWWSGWMRAALSLHGEAPSLGKMAGESVAIRGRGGGAWRGLPSANHRGAGAGATRAGCGRRGGSDGGDCPARVRAQVGMAETAWRAKMEFFSTMQGHTTEIVWAKLEDTRAVLYSELGKAR